MLKKTTISAFLIIFQGFSGLNSCEFLGCPFDRMLAHPTLKNSKKIFTIGGTFISTKIRSIFLLSGIDPQ